MDETFGGLYTALLTTGNLGATLPGLTARLELDYKKKIPAGDAVDRALAMSHHCLMLVLGHV